MRLPSGGETRSRARYLREWKALGRRVARVLGAGYSLGSFDPDLHFQFAADGVIRTARGVTLPAWACQRIADATYVERG